MGVTAFVPARSGSKRLPGKNIKPLAGRPLVLWTLAACVNAPSIDKVIFSTDSEEYWDLACREFGKTKLQLDWRDADEAGDKVKIFDYIKGARKKIFGDLVQDKSASFFMGLPTAPFRNTQHIEEAIALHTSRNKPVFSANEYGFAVSCAFYMEPGGAWTSVAPGNPMETGNTRSQDQRVAYHPNGAIYVRKIADLENEHMKTLYDDAITYLMDRKFMVDIDTDADFIVAEAMVTAGIIKK
jgi:CMP-N-acetylneuraminic acid synthetase